LNQIDDEDDESNYEQEVDQVAAPFGLNFRRFIYPEIQLLAKLFQWIESRLQGYRAEGLQGCSATKRDGRS
jgi:hypothetical protein